MPSLSSAARLAASLAAIAQLTAATAQASSHLAVGREAAVASLDGLNIRRGPAPDGEVLAVAGVGEVVRVLAGPEPGGGAGGYRVERGGAAGWASGGFLAPVRERPSPSARGGARAVVAPEVVRLPVPYRTQLDGSFYQAGNCGPATLGMVLAAFGKEVPTADLRRTANRVQGTTGIPDSGVAIDVLAGMAVQYGLEVRGLRTATGYDRWSFDEVRQALRAGHLVIPQVHFASLPGHETRDRSIDHYIVLTGFEGDRFVYNDSAFAGAAGYRLSISEGELAVAWRKGDYPFAAFSVGPGPDVPALIDPPAVAAAARPAPVTAAPAHVPAPPRPESPASVPAAALVEIEPASRGPASARPGRDDFAPPEHTRPDRGEPAPALHGTALGQSIGESGGGPVNDPAGPAPLPAPLRPPAWPALLCALVLAMLGASYPLRLARSAVQAGEASHGGGRRPDVGLRRVGRPRLRRTRPGDRNGTGTGAMGAPGGGGLVVPRFPEAGADVGTAGREARHGSSSSS